MQNLWPGRATPRFLLLAAITLVTLPAARGLVLSQRCGAELADALRTVCGQRGFYYSDVGKRMAPAEGATDDDDEGSPAEAGLSRVRRGIVSECCRQPCTMSMLESYCNEGVEEMERARVLARMAQEQMRAAAVESGSSARGSSSSSSSSGSGSSSSQLARGSHSPGGANVGRMSDLHKNRPFFFVTPSRRQFDFPRAVHKAVRPRLAPGRQ